MVLLKRRARLHQLAAEAYEQFFPGRLDMLAPLLARHWIEAGERAKAAEYLIRAGDAANRLFAPVEARLHYARALEILSLLPDSDENRRRQIGVTTQYAKVAFGFG